MSRFESIASAFHAGPLLEQFGETSIVTNPGESGITTTVIVYRNELEETGAAQYPAYPMECDIPRTDVATITPNATTVTAKKRMSDSAAVTYTVGHIISQDGQFWRVTLVR